MILACVVAFVSSCSRANFGEFESVAPIREREELDNSDWSAVERSASLEEEEKKEAELEPSPLWGGRRDLYQQHRYLKEDMKEDDPGNPLPNDWDWDTDYQSDY